MAEDQYQFEPISGLSGFTPFLLLFLVVFTANAWFFSFGSSLVLLWYHDGQLQKKFKTYDIQPLYIRERLAQENATERSKILCAGRWSRDVARMSLERIQEVDDAGLRRRIFEEKRVSRLPAFEQDDGGDGSEFPDMPVDMTAEEYNLQHFPKRYEDARELGLEKLAKGDWVTCSHAEQMAAREQILDEQERRKKCVAMQLGSIAEEACGEVWMEVAEHLMGKYKERFWVQNEAGARKLLYDSVTGESYPLAGPYGWLTLDSIARLVREDLCIFKKSPFAADYVLLAGATLFPSGWCFQAQLGHSISSQQEMVLPWEQLPEIFAYMDDHRDDSTYKRHVTFIQTTQPHGSDLVNKYFIEKSKDFFTGNISSLQPDTIHVRIERQVFRRLPKSNAIVMTTRLQVEPLVRMKDEGKLRHLAKEIRSWPAHIAKLKGYDLWGRAVLGYIEDFPMAHDDLTVIDAGELTEEEGFD